jgi:WD40 repeat protein
MDSWIPPTILFLSIIISIFWTSVPSGGADKCDFEGTSIRAYVQWDGSYRAFRWNTEGLEKIRNPSPPDDPRSRTNVARPFGDELSSELPQQLFLPDRRLDVPFSVSRNGRMAVSAVHGRANTLPLSQEFAVIDLRAKSLLHLVKTDYYIESVTWAPTGRYFAVLFSENVTKQLWKGPLDLLGDILGHPRSYYTIHAMIYTLDGKVMCKRTIAEKLLNGKGYIDWE